MPTNLRNILFIISLLFLSNPQVLQSRKISNYTFNYFASRFSRIVFIFLDWIN